MNERTLSFRPFRRVDGKLVITSYSGWRKLYTANREGAIVNLLKFPTIKKGESVYSIGNPNGDYKYWHPTKFETLFYPINAVIRYCSIEDSISLIRSGEIHPYSLPIKDNEVHSIFDCDGCPTLSHITAVYVSENYPEKIDLFEPLDAEIVYMHFERVMDELKNIKWNL